MSHDPMNAPDSARTSSPLLAVHDLTMRFGGLLAVDGVSLTVAPDEIFAIIGPNGAGKTTVFNCIGGFYRPTGGSIRLDGHEIAGKPSHQVARHGLVRTFQNVRLFKQLTVLENLLVAQHTQVQSGLLAGLLRLPSYRRAEAEAIRHAAQWLDFMGLREYANREAGNLAYGHQRRLEIARCMITRPRLLMLDEPAAGHIRFEGQDIARLDTPQIMRNGIAISPEGRRVFADMTVTENLQMGGFFQNREDIEAGLEHAFNLFPRLRERAHQRAGTMSGGEQQMLAIGRALMSRPRLLLLDEPTLGLAPLIIAQIFEIIQKIRSEGVTVFLVEQNANRALQLADRGYVLENGRIVLEDSGQNLLANDDIRKAYLGV